MQSVETFNRPMGGIASPKVGVFPTLREIDDLKRNRIFDISISDDTSILRAISDSKKYVYVTKQNEIICAQNPESASLVKLIRDIFKNKGIEFKQYYAFPVVLEYLHNSNIVQSNDDEFSEKSGIADHSDDSSVQIFFKSIIQEATRRNASDIKIYIRDRTDSLVMFKISGSYCVIDEFSNKNKNTYLDMMRSMLNFHNHIHGGAHNSLFKDDAPMDQQIPIDIPGHGKVKIRLGGIPGENKTLGISLRIPQFSKRDSLPSLMELGFLEEQAALIEDALKAPFGLILFTGETGSGKSTALASALALRPDNSPTVTIEHPVEVTLKNKPAIIQCSVDEESEDMNWAALLKQSLRQDPDTIMIGEIRDPQVAATLHRAAGTGHLVLSTMHVNSVINVANAFEHYGLPVYKIAEKSFLRLLIGMRLIKKTCTKCCLDFEKAKLWHGNNRITKRIEQYFSQDIGRLRFHNPRGCKECTEGFKGVSLIAEVAYVDGVARRFILERKPEAWKEHLLRNGWISIKKHAEILVTQGQICPIFVESKIESPFGEDDSEDFTFSYEDFRRRLDGEIT